MKSKSLLATMFPKNLNTETLYHIIQNRISLLVVTGAQCTRKKERNTDAVFISPLSRGVDILVGLKEDKKHDCVFAFFCYNTLLTSLSLQ